MSKTNILNLVLFIIVISLATVIYFSEVEDNRLALLNEADISTIQSITIQHNNNTTSLIRTDSQGWKITHPVAISANSFRVNSLLKLLNAPVHQQYPVNTIDLSTIGLSNPTTTISFDEKEIAFGISNNATSLRYIKQNDIIYTIEDVYYPLISSNFGTLTSLNLLPDNSHIKKLTIKNHTIEKDDDGFWKSSIEMTADSINEVVDNWKNAQAFGVHEYLDREEIGRITISFVNNSPITYTITDIDPWLILARPELGLEYHLDIAAYTKLIEPR